MSTDAQSRAFRDAGPSDRVPDEELHTWAERVHEPIQSATDVRQRVHWFGWDAARTRPKTVQEAREVLQGRISVRRAPDGPEVIGAYDALPDTPEVI